MLRLWLRISLVVLLFLICCALPLLIAPHDLPHGAEDSRPAVTPVQSPAAAAIPETSPLPSAVLPYRAVWISYLEWQNTDFSSAAAFEKQVSAMFERCANAGFTVVLVQVRPFGDALYPSELFPFSHLCSGVQGQDPGFDPLAIAVEQAHLRGLEIEAWINPYRLQNAGVPSQLSEDNLAATHPDWVKEAADGLWLDPADPAVQAYIAEGVQELCENYALDGIHFDDYFYPTTDASFDADAYADYCADGGNLPLDDWRRENVSSLVTLCWQTAHNYGMRFGISPQGNLQNNRDIQYSDVERWLSETGFTDYLIPQIYWGLDYEEGTASPFAFDNCLKEWLSLPRAEGVALYAGLGAYRIGDGDGSTASLPEWNSGHALAEQVSCLRALGLTGFAVYRYDSLFASTAWPDLAEQEVLALKSLLDSFSL